MTIKSPVLVLNASYEPIAICQARRALTLLVKGAAAVEESHDVLVWHNMRMPSVIRLSRYRKVPIRAEALSSAALKLEALAESEPNSARAGFGELVESWTCGSKTYRAYEKFIALLIEAILRKKRCRVTYRKPSGSEAKTYEFDPYRLLFVGGGLYVIGRVPTHAVSTATLAIDRLQSVVHSEIEFQVDPKFNSQKCRQDAFGVSWEDPLEVVLRFRADHAPYVRERLWHPSQEIKELPGGRLQLSFRAGGPFEIRRWILGWGDAVEVISPETLRLEIGRLLDSALSTYRN